MGSSSREVDWDSRSIDTELTMVQKSWRTNYTQTYQMLLT